MKCKKITRLLSRYLDADVLGQVRARIEEHLAGCQACRAELAALEADAALLGSVAGPEAPAYLAARVLASVRQPARRAPFWVRAAATAAAVVLVAAGAWLGTVLGRSIAGSQSDSTEALFSVNGEPSLDDLYQALAGEGR